MLPVVILHAVGVVVVVGDERRPLQHTGAGAAAETVGMETLAHRLQHPVCDLLPAPGAHGQGVLWTHDTSLALGDLSLALDESSLRYFMSLKYYIMAILHAPHHVAVLALGRAVPVIELHALQGAVAAHAAEAVGVEELVHGPHRRLGARQSLAALPTDLCQGMERETDYSASASIFKLRR